MATQTSSIDDVLATAHLPAETKTIEPEPPKEIPAIEDTPIHDNEYEHPTLKEELAAAQPEEKEDTNQSEVDDYGNEKPKQESKTYTEDEVNERINKAVRERLSRLKQEPIAPASATTQPAQQMGQDFEYNPNAEGTWQQQLESFVEQTVSKMSQKQAALAQQQREQAAQMEFEAKFHQGMGRFADFRQVVGNQPITDAMTVATRAMTDPAAFLYAAAKRHPTDLQRIANLSDPYTQMVEMGRLEERMRKGREASKTPRPLSHTKEDTTIQLKEDKQPTIEELMAQADQRKLSKMRARRS